MLPNKRLPNGALLYVRNVPFESTPETLSTEFAKRGLAIPVDHIDVRHGEFSKIAHAVISVPTATIADLVDAALGRAVGLRVEPLVPSQRRDYSPKEVRREIFTDDTWPPSGVTR
jgi:RNA recognition motif-containing protein